MKFLKIAALATLGVTLGVLTCPNPAQAKSYMISGQPVHDYALNDFQYYKVKRATPLRFLYSNNTTKKRIVPKGTIIIGHKYPGSSVEKPSIAIYLSQLDYNFLNKGRPKHLELLSISDAIGSSRPQDYQRIARPAYLPAMSLGDLRQTQFNTDSTYGTKTYSQLRLTSNGFAEFSRFKNPNNINAAQRPQFRQKIEKATNKGNTRQLYFAKKIPGLGMKKVKQTGKLKYRLTLVNQHQPFQNHDPEDESDLGFYSRYTVGGKTFVTQIG